MLKTTLSLVPAVLVLSILAGTASANLLLNGGFETGDFSNWTPSGPNLKSVGTGSPNSGTYSAFFTGDFDITPNVTSLVQVISTTPGAYYDLSYALRLDSFGNVAGSSVTNSFAAYWNGVLIPTSALNDIADFGYSTIVKSGLQATGATTQVQFLFGNTYLVDPGICPSPAGEWSMGDASVELAADQNPAPEPASLALAAVAVAGLLALNFKRK